MKKISIDQIISVTKKQPFTARSLEFLQNALDEDKAAIVKAMITQNLGSYSLTTGYIISGCVLSDSDKDITAGEIFYGGKFYETTAVNGTTNPACLVLTKTQDATADSITFTNGDVGNVHDIYKFIATDATVSTHLGVTDILGTALVSVYGTGKITSQLTLASQATSSATYVDMTGLDYTTPNDGVTRKFKFTLKSDSDLDGVSGVGSSIAQAYFRIYNDTDATELDESQTTTSILVSAATQDVAAVVTANCCSIVSIAPNKTVKCQFKLTSGTSVTATKAKFFIEEV